LGAHTLPTAGIFHTRILLPRRAADTPNNPIYINRDIASDGVYSSMEGNVSVPALSALKTFCKGFNVDDIDSCTKVSEAARHRLLSSWPYMILLLSVVLVAAWYIGRHCINLKCGFRKQNSDVADAPWNKLTINAIEKQTKTVRKRTEELEERRIQRYIWAWTNRRVHMQDDEERASVAQVQNVSPGLLKSVDNKGKGKELDDDETSVSSDVTVNPLDTEGSLEAGDVRLEVKDRIDFEVDVYASKSILCASSGVRVEATDMERIERTRFRGVAATSISHIYGRDDDVAFEIEFLESAERYVEFEPEEKSRQCSGEIYPRGSPGPHGTKMGSQIKRTVVVPAPNTWGLMGGGWGWIVEQDDQ